MVPLAIKRQAMWIAQTHAHANLHTCPSVATETGRACAFVIAEIQIQKMWIYHLLHWIFYTLNYVFTGLYVNADLS